LPLASVQDGLTSGDEPGRVQDDVRRQAVPPL
jgi:hypothetical protein